MAISDPSGSVVPILGTENYRIRSGALKLALQARNKYGLVYFDNAATVWKELNETYDKVDGYVVYNLLQKINSVKQGGSFVTNYYHRLNSLWREFDALTKLPNSLLTRDPLPEVKDAYNVVFREESHRGVHESSGVMSLNVASSGWPFVSAVPGQMTHLVASLTLDSARSCVMQGTSFTQGKVSSIPTVFSWGGSISPNGFLPSILLLLVIIVAVAIVVTVILVVIVGEGSSIIKLSFVIIGSLHRIMLCYLIH
ncbi:hypothetical protein Tco_1385427 [Tanacetum coccineum]